VGGAAPVAGRDYPGTYAQLLAWFPDDRACLDYLDWLRAFRWRTLHLVQPRDRNSQSCGTAPHTLVTSVLGRVPLHLAPILVRPLLVSSLAVFLLTAADTATEDLAQPLLTEAGGMDRLRARARFIGVTQVGRTMIPKRSQAEATSDAGMRDLVTVISAASS